jgi:PAS domain S-box-containing protein
MKLNPDSLKAPGLLGVYAVLGGMFTGGMAYLVQGRAFGFENVPIIAVVPAFLVGFIAAAVIAYLVLRKQVALRESAHEFAEKTALLATTFDTMAQGYAVYDRDMRLVRYNKQFETLFDYPQGFLYEGIGLGDLVRFRAERGDYGDVDIERIVKGRVEFAIKPAERSTEHTLATGKKYIHHRKSLPDGGCVTTYTDITERARIERELQETETLLHLVANASPVLISYINRDRRIQFANKAFASRHGTTPEEIIGKHQEEYWGKDRHESVSDLVQRTLAGEVTMNEGQREHADGSMHYHLTSRAPHFDEDGNVKGYLNIILDVTNQKRIEENLKQAQKMEAVGQLTGGVAHDFNNLLAVIMGSAELLAEEPQNGAQLIETIQRASSRGAELTQRLLAFSRRQPLHPQPVDMSELVAHMRTLAQRTLGETIEISTDVAPDLWQAQADPGQVENAILNLALNARDAMRGGGKLTIACTNAALDEDFAAEHIEVAAGDYVVLEVGDTGMGMTEEVLAHAFEPFYTTKGVGEGSGLGLSMVYGFAKQSGGHAVIHSEEGKGTTVRLYLPRASVDVSARPETGSEEVPMGRGEMVLVVEDDPDVCDLVEAMVGSLGYSVITASTAAEGRTALESQEIDLVLSDVVLPGGVNGPAFAQEARDLRPGLRVIFMSGYPAGAAGHNSGLGLDDVLVDKPFRKQDIATALHEALN